MDSSNDLREYRFPVFRAKGRGSGSSRTSIVLGSALDSQSGDVAGRLRRALDPAVRSAAMADRDRLTVFDHPAPGLPSWLVPASPERSKRGTARSL